MSKKSHDPEAAGLHKAEHHKLAEHGQARADVKTARPVTQVAEVAVKSASIKPTGLPTEEMGNMSRPAPTRIMAAKLSRMSHDGLIFHFIKNLAHKKSHSETGMTKKV
ncbi:MAG: hypothetical protein MZV63_26575 [Marinilabiliales bacterium]|nr:hypothetical protein [Marinilabiliales bacterium]